MHRRNSTEKKDEISLNQVVSITVNMSHSTPLTLSGKVKLLLMEVTVK